MKEAILSRPWIFVLVGYLLAVSASITMVVIAVKHGDQPVPVATPHR
jgi:hypothetical protein